MKQTIRYLFILLIVLISELSFSQSNTVTYPQQTTNYLTTFTDGGTFSGYTSNSYAGIVMTAPYDVGNNGQVVAWRPFTSDGSSDVSKRRSLHVGDQFTIYDSITEANGEIGIALLATPTSEANWGDRINNAVVSVFLPGPLSDQNPTPGVYGPWQVNANNGSSITSIPTQFGTPTGGYQQYHVFRFLFTLNAPDRITVEIDDMTGGGNTTVYRANDIQISTATITDYSIYLSRDYTSAGTNYGMPVYWEGASVYGLPNMQSTGGIVFGYSGNSFIEANVIPDGLYADQPDGGTSRTNQLTISGNATITLTNANTYTGITTISSGANPTLVLNNTGGGTIPETNSISVENGGTLKVSSNQTLKNLNLENGSTLFIDADITLTITGTLTDNGATITNNGRIVIAPGAIFLNKSAVLNVTLQQNIIAQRGWRMFANPFSTSTVLSTVASDNNISINTLAVAPSLTDALLYDNGANNWANVSSGASIAPNTAYGLFIRGKASEVTGADYSSGPSAFIFGVTGTLNNGNVPVTPTTAGNFMMVGNPYAAPVTSSALTDGAGVPYYVYTITQGGTPAAQQTKAGEWIAEVASSTSATIPVLGSIVYTPTSTTSYNITLSDINTTGTSQTGLFGGNQNSIPYVELQIESQGIYQDKLFARLDKSATASGNDKIDLKKFTNDNVNIYTIAPDNTHLAVDARNSFDSVALGLNALKADYTFKVASNSLPDGITAYLIDKLLNTKTELIAGSAYNFSVTSDSATQGNNRFEIVFSFTNKQGTTADNPSSAQFNATVLGNVTENGQISVQITGLKDAKANIKVLDENGVTINTTQATNGINHVNIQQAGAGLILLQISDGKNTIIKKVMKL